MISKPISPVGSVRARAVCGTAGSLFTLAATALASPAQAQTQSRWAVDASASAGVSTNPYLGQRSSGGAALDATLDVRPSIVIERPLTTLELSADGQVSFYDHHYPTNESFTLNGAGTHKLSERTTLTAALGYVNTIVGGVYGVGLPVVDVLPVAPTPAADASTASAPVTNLPPLDLLTTNLPAYVNDPALGGLGRRRQSYQASGGIGTMISARDQIGADTSASLNRFGGADLNDFNYVTPSIYWRRALSARTSIGATFQASFTDYLDTRVGDATTYAPEATLSRVLGGGWTLDAGLGVTFVRLHEASGGTRSATSLSGSATACRRDTRRSICVTASRQVAPSAFQGVRTETSVSGSLGYRLNERDDLSLGAAYSHADDPLQRTVIGTRTGSLDYVTANGSYSHRFAPMLSGFFSAGFAKAFGNEVNRGSTFTAQVGVSYRFGVPR